MSQTIFSIANEALRVGVVEAVRRMSAASLDELCRAVEAGPYAEILRTVTVAELRSERRPKTVRVTCERGADPKQAILLTFQRHPAHAFSSRLFIQQLGLPRWTVGTLLGELVAAGLIRRSGRTASTRYRLAVDESSERSRGRRTEGGEG